MKPTSTTQAGPACNLQRKRSDSSSLSLCFDVERRFHRHAVLRQSVPDPEGLICSRRSGPSATVDFFDPQHDIYMHYRICNYTEAHADIYTYIYI